jgi:ABC-2 type transport system permease protein
LKGKNFFLNIGGTVLISVIFMAFSLWLWKKGIAAYESAGS